MGVLDRLLQHLRLTAKLLEEEYGAERGRHSTELLRMLPLEMWYFVFEYTDIVSLTRCRLVSLQFSRLVDSFLCETKRILLPTKVVPYHRVNSGPGTHWNLNELIQTHLWCNINWRHITELDVFDQILESAMVSRLVQCPLQYMRKLSIWVCDCQYLELLRPNVLFRLRVSNIRSNESDCWSMLCKIHSTSLRHIHIGTRNFTDFSFECLPELLEKVLITNATQNFDLNSLKVQILTHLSIQMAHRHRYFVKFPEDLWNVRELNLLNSEWHILPEGISSLSEICPKLERLRTPDLIIDPRLVRNHDNLISYHGAMIDRTVGYLKDLRHLTITMTRDGRMLTETGLLGIAKRNPDLVSLAFRESSVFYLLDAVISLVKSCRRLTELELPSGRDVNSLLLRLPLPLQRRDQPLYIRTRRAELHLTPAWLTSRNIFVEEISEF